jgi:hypothetical protein
MHLIDFIAVSFPFGELYLSGPPGFVDPWLEQANMSPWPAVVKDWPANDQMSLPSSGLRIIFGGAVSTCTSVTKTGTARSATHISSALPIISNPSA